MGDGAVESQTQPFSRAKIRVIVWRDLLSRIHGLRCADGDVDECTVDRKICESKAGVYLRATFDICPIRACLDDFALMASLSLENQFEIAPPSGWPDDYAGGVVDLLLAIKETRNKKQLDEMKRAGHG